MFPLNEIVLSFPVSCNGPRSLPQCDNRVQEFLSKDFDLLTSGIISQRSRTAILLSFNNASSAFAIVSSETDGYPERCSS
ncbi:hypothetical protein TNCV_844021 [Trichonephila clavipes]|nr:hypothetical protein TNCV_844021 [Trichonephila clavipes]